MQKELILIRGLPGSGKSTLAQHFVALGARHYEADNYFTVNDTYLYRPEDIRLAHTECYARTRESLRVHYPLVVVSNTFTRTKELKIYLDLAKAYNYTSTVLTVENYHGNSSVHNVPEETLQKMQNRFTVKLR